MLSIASHPVKCRLTCDNSDGNICFHFDCAHIHRSAKTQYPLSKATNLIDARRIARCFILSEHDMTSYDKTPTSMQLFMICQSVWLASQDILSKFLAFVIGGKKEKSEQIVLLNVLQVDLVVRSSRLG